MTMKKHLGKLALAGGLIMVLSASECSNDADTASRNLSVAADNFEVMRRVVFYNGITDSYVMSVEGFCSIGNNDSYGRLSVTCKTGPREFKKHYLGLSDNVTFFAQQMDPVGVSTFHNRIIFKPQSILPDIDFKFDAEELIDNQNGNG